MNSQLTEDEEYINNLPEKEKKAMLSILALAHTDYIKSSRNDKDKSINAEIKNHFRDSMFDVLFGEGNWKLEKE